MGIVNFFEKNQISSFKNNHKFTQRIQPLLLVQISLITSHCQTVVDLGGSGDSTIPILKVKHIELIDIVSFDMSQIRLSYIS